MASNILAELSSISTQAQELMDRIVIIGDQHRNNPDSQFVTECNSAERSLMSAIRALERSKKYVD